VKHWTLCAAACAAGLLAGTASAFDGWHQQSETNIGGGSTGWDYVTFDEGTRLLFIGHKGDGLQVYDPVARKVVKTIAGTAAASSTGATLIPEFDLGVSNNEDGTLTPFRLSTQEASAPVRLGDDLDTSHYDPAAKRLLVNMGGGADGTDVIALDLPGLRKAGTVHVASKKPEGGVADGKGAFYLALQDRNTIVRIDTRRLAVTASWSTAPACGKPTGIAMDTAHRRLFVSCRGGAEIKPSLIVMDADKGAVLFSTEIGGGSDGILYDAGRRRIFSSNGVSANLSVVEQQDADHYRLLETLGTRAAVRTLALDRQTGTLFSVTGEGSADTGKKINTNVSPYYANHFFPNTLTVLTYGK
jgi:hypothetical protein